ncbi:phospholipase A1 PLIP1, chloroplastic-like [Aristolochia californica]|uniref:phospholipase A1 PLIP1, chloroplastic-like n=1 Tax=Aristolochia californica TaxID=171875 RepID=UPI0035DE6B3B
MAYNSLSSTSLSAKEIFRGRDAYRRTHSSTHLLDRSGRCRSRSEPHLCCSLKLAQATTAETKLKSSRSFGIFPFNFSGSIIPTSVKSFLFEQEYCNEVQLEDPSTECEGEEVMETEKRANWVERLMELRTRWKDRQKEDSGEGESSEDDLCGVSYEEEIEEISFDRESFSKLLATVPWSQTKLFSQLAFLCNMAYVIPEIKIEDLRKYYGLHFVTSSLEKKAEAALIKAQLDRDSNVVPESTGLPQQPVSEKTTRSKVKKRLNRPSAAYDIAASAAAYVHSQAKELLSMGSSSDGAQADELRKECPQMEDRNDGANSPSRVYKSEVAAYVAASAMTAVVAAEETAKSEAARDLRSLHSSPCEWLVCDDPVTCRRSFVIQGSDSLASWQTNLFFDPTKFEGTDVQVHRGIYEAAKGIYEQLMPEILHHLNLYGARSKLQFSGHSLGGSLSLLVNLMLLRRGVVTPRNLLPVVTFGSPSVFCGGRRVLEELGLDENHVCSVVMHRDIVPRAFSCDYPSQVVLVLKRLNGAFRTHPCLNSHKVLYSPLGKLFILQPDESSSPSHPLIPPGSGFYSLDDSKTASPASALRTFFNNPHPLETLSDPTAYGSEGTILRDHDSSNYLKAINRVLRQHTKWLVRQWRKERLHHWWPLLTMSPHTWVHEGIPDNRSLVRKEVVTGV